MKLRWFILALLLLPLRASAQGTYTANSCNYSDVNAVINGPTHTAVNGDTINIPAGSCTWTSGITIPAGIGISIIGAGTPNTGTGTVGAGTSTTTITQNFSGHSFLAHPTYGNATMRFSLMNLQPASGLSGGGDQPIMVIGTCASGGCPNIRIDNITFPSSWQSVGLNDYSLIMVDNVFGVLDHNSPSGASGYGVCLVNVNHSAWKGVGEYGDNSWYSPDTFGTAQALYLENNLLTVAFGTDTDGSDTYQDIGGGRFVCRYNTFNSVSEANACANHGTESTGRPRGGRQEEAYNNTVTCTNTSQGCGAAFGSRSGASLVYNNNISAGTGSWFNHVLDLNMLRSFRGPASPWGTCDGTGPYDLNDGTTYGSGTVTTSGTGTFSDSNATWTLNEWAGSAVTNGTPYSIHDVTQNFGDEITANTSAPVQYTFILAPNNAGNTSPWTWNTSDSYQILRATVCIDQPGRGQSSVLLSGDTPTPTGWVGDALDPVYEWGDTHTGTLSQALVGGDSTNRFLNNRDFYYQCGSLNSTCSGGFTGAAGTGTGTYASRPSTCIPYVAYWATDQNTLYKCTATNTWTAFYTPYTYPHPLTGGTPVAPAVNLFAKAQ